MNGDLSTKTPTSNLNLSDAIIKTSHPYVNQNPLLFDPNHTKSPQKKLESTNANANVHAIEPITSVIPGKLKQTPPTITVTPTDDADKIIDGMLDRISHDLDYLLNRTADMPPVPPPPVSVTPSALYSLPNRVHDVIIEEESEET